MLTLINSENDLRDALQKAANGARIVVDPASAPVTVTQKITVNVTKDLFYFDGSGLRVGTNIANYDHCFEFTNGKPGFKLKNIYVTGSYPHRQCGDAFRFICAPAGNEDSFYNFFVSGIRIEHVAGNGIFCQGVFEGGFDAVETNDIGKSGMVFTNGPSGGGTTTQVTCSNCQLSRCDGWGAEQLGGSDQVTWIAPVFVCNGMGGIHASDGIHLIVNPRMENAGQTMVVVDRQSWAGAEIVSPQLASDGAWVRSWVNPHTGPSQYVVKCPQGAVTVTGVAKLRGYGGSATQPGWLQVYYPGSQKAGLQEYTPPPTKDMAQQQARPMVEVAPGRPKAKG